MPKKGSPPLEGELLQGTLDLLILQTLALRPGHGHTIAYAIEHRSEDVLQVQHGSLYPALHRLEDRGWIASFWGTSENNRTLPNSGFPAGRKSEANLYDSSYRQEIRLRILLTKHLGSGVAWGKGRVEKAAMPPGRREERTNAQTDAENTGQIIRRREGSKVGAEGEKCRRKTRKRNTLRTKPECL